jgi:predicted O-methyltransferase YrrM
MTNFAQRLSLAICDPVEAYYKAIAHWHWRKERTQPACHYTADLDWRNRLGVTSEDREHTARIYGDVICSLEARGIRPGPESYLYWNDADPAFAEAIWCLIRRTNAMKVVETGVAHGVTSRVILEALKGHGRLWSIDYPPPGTPEIHEEIGAAVGAWPKEEWELIFGSSQRRLPKLLKSIAPIDLFVHDSDHRGYNVKFEMALAWNSLRPGGAMVIDDIDNSGAFATFVREVGARSLICEAEPIRPDTRRYNQNGVFGILIKSTS